MEVVLCFPAATSAFPAFHGCVEPGKKSATNTLYMGAKCHKGFGLHNTYYQTKNGLISYWYHYEKQANNKTKK